MSGGRATVKFKAGKANATQGGDISSLDPAGHVLTDKFSIECKFYKDLKLDTSLLRGYGPLIEFWRQARKDAKRQDKSPMLIVKQNGWPTLMVLNPIGVEALGVEGLELVVSNTNRGRRCLYVFDLEEVLKNEFQL